MIKPQNGSNPWAAVGASVLHEDIVLRSRNANKYTGTLAPVLR